MPRRDRDVVALVIGNGAYEQAVPVAVDAADLGQHRTTRLQQGPAGCVEVQAL